MSDQTAEEKLTYLRELVLNARAMPMSASCVINRGEVLTAIDDVVAGFAARLASTAGTPHRLRRACSSRVRASP